MKKLPLFQKEKSDKIRFKNHYPTESSTLSLFLVFFIFFLFFLLFLRLFQLTIVKGNYYYRLAEENRIRELIIEAPRGEIIDRKGLVIAKNLPADISKNSDRLTSLRHYQAGEAAGPIIGYRQTASEDDLKDDHCLSKLKMGDKTGKKGVEKLYDCELRGRPGKKLIEVDAQGRYLKTLTVIDPSQGKTIQLALDWQLQQRAYQLLEGKKGAVVAVKPNTGEILILVSSPSFDPQVFENNNQKAIKKILESKEKPLFNRATEGVYPPGSIFKLVVAAAALEEKKINKDTLIEDTGIVQLGPLTFGNWYYLEYGKTEGMVDIVKAIQRSNDIFFYKTGEKLGPEKIKLWAKKFAYGSKFNFGLGESSGLIPSPFWKEEVIGDRWYTGDTYNLSIGQGYILVTPLQVTMATTVIANGGYLCQPQLIKVKSQKLKVKNCQKLPISQKTLFLIQEGMKQACSPGGTGWPLFKFKVQSLKFKVQEIQTGCKTGTAESHGENKSPHAWFTIFAPYEKPEIVLTVLVENGGQGSDVAAPIAKEILKAYFEREQ